MRVKMKYLDTDLLRRLNQSSLSSGRSQHLSQEQVSDAGRDRYLVNFHFDHACKSVPDIRLSIILIPGVLTAWLDISTDEFAALPEVELSELEWEAAVCVGVPRWLP
jgi:hypothetical protein